MLLDNQVGSVTSLLYDIARKLGVEGIAESAMQPELLSAIFTFLIEGQEKGVKVLLIIDDAQEVYAASMKRLICLLTGDLGEETGFLQMILFGTQDTETKMVEVFFRYFEDETIKAIHVASGGNIAQINELAHRAIRRAFAAGATTVAPDFVV